jgi:uncharacterized radical SAM superfamily protein
LYLDVTNVYNAKDVSPANLDVVRDVNSNPVIINPDAPVEDQKYQLQYLRNNGSNILPTIGLILEL